jgi:hypothetical protein
VKSIFYAFDKKKTGKERYSKVVGDIDAGSMNAVLISASIILMDVNKNI